MYYRLKPDYLMRGWERLPNALVNRKSGKAIFLRQEEMEAVKLCCGTVDDALPLFPQQYKPILAMIVKSGLAEAFDAPQPIAPEQEYRLYPARYIHTAHWSVTGRCNYRCKHCFMSAPDAKLGELSHETILNIARQIVDCGIMNVSLTGGEPLVRKDFMEIVDTLLAGGVRITTIYSNGKLVTDGLLSALEERGIHPEFNMSFDGVGWHDWLRGVDGAEDIVKDAFLRCRERGFPTGAEMCMHQGNKDTLRESVRLLGSLGCHHLKVVPVADEGAWHEGGHGDMSLSMPELNQLYLDYIPQYYEDGMPLSLQLSGFFSASPKAPDSYVIPVKKDCRDPEKMCLCGHARNVLYISPESRTLPCMSLSGMDIQQRFPLITEIGLANCLNDSFYMNFIDTRVSQYFEKNPECKACPHALACCGGCRADALSFTPQNLLGRDLNTCEIYRGGWMEKIDRAVAEAMKKRAEAAL